MVVALGSAICAEATEPGACTVPGQQTLSGTVPSLQSMREEPHAAEQTFLDVVLPEAMCGQVGIAVHVIGESPCAFGDAATVTSDFETPSKLSGLAHMSAELGAIVCTPPKR